MINELPIAILGFGKTGVSVAEYLHKKNKHFYVFENNETVEKLNQFNSLSDASKNKIFFGHFYFYGVRIYLILLELNTIMVI